MRRSSLSPRPQIRTPSISPRRLLAFGGFLAAWILVIVGRLYGLQIIEYVRWVSVQKGQEQHTVTVMPLRGTIYDRHHRPLAITLPVDSVYARPREISDRRMEASLLAPVLGVSAADVEERFSHSQSFQWVSRGISRGLAGRVRDLDLKGIYTEKDSKRFYPHGALAAAVMGFTGVDDQGLAGIESGLNTLIAGRPSKMLVERDARRQSFHSTEQQGHAGADVTLTLDENIQYIAEKALADAIEQHHAAGGVAVVENPLTGEILAMVSQPTFDPNHYEQAQPGERMDRAIQWVYEPGSMFKIVTYSGVLEEGLASPDEMIDCQMGSITIAGHVIHDDERFGTMTVEQALAHSSNVAAIKLGMRLGDEGLYRYIRKFGFGSRTGIDLPGEEAGLLEPPSRWSAISIGAIPMGQEVAVTALQLISAYSAIANGGVLMPPRILEQVAGDADAVPRRAQPRRVVSPRTAELMRQMFAMVVSDGTGKAAQLDGYSAAGKTGTGQKVVNGVYSHSRHVSSFVGFAPVEHPAVAVLVSLDSPVGVYYAAEVAAPLFKVIADQTLAYLNVPKDRPASLLAHGGQPGIPAKATNDAEERQLASLASKRMLSDSPDTLPEVKPVALTGNPRAPAPGTVTLTKGPLVTVPDFTGLAARPVADKCEALGVELLMVGSGLASEQDPPAGSQVSAGTTVKVRFVR
ncbi:MAG TPA: penicillin-binding protein [Terriglobia bacterium]|nr:penicillin-binding protein [Terriglobia bacterium]